MSSRKIGFVMQCAHKGSISSKACPATILGLTDNAALTRCQACAHGQRLMATVRINPEEAFYTPDSATVAAPQETLSTEVRSDTMPTENTPRTYTIDELAALIGVDGKSVANAKYSRAKTFTPGSKMAMVREYMSERGITWDQVINRPRGKKAGAAGGGAYDDARYRANRASCAAEEPAASNPTAELADTVAGIEPHAASGLIPEPVRTPAPAAAFAPVSVPAGEDESLEEIIRKLRHRLPGAAITITLQ